jgi:hypothetical protein
MPYEIKIFLIALYLYSLVRFAVKSSFKFSDVYRVKYFLLVIFIPFAGYFIAINALAKRQALTDTE